MTAYSATRRGRLMPRSSRSAPGTSAARSSTAPSQTAGPAPRSRRATRLSTPSGARGAHAIRADVLAPAQLDAALAEAAELLGGLDAVVDAVSIARMGPGDVWGGGPIGRRRPSRDSSAGRADVARQAFLFLSLGARALRAHGGGSARAGDERDVAPPRSRAAGLWSAAHHAMRAMTLSAAQELARGGNTRLRARRRRADRLAEVGAAARRRRHPTRGRGRHGRDREARRSSSPDRDRAASRTSSGSRRSGPVGRERPHRRSRAAFCAAATRVTRSFAAAATTR